MKWAPEDRLNAFAARLLAKQPDPPRKIGMADLLKTDVALLGLLAVPVILGVGGFVIRQAPVFALIGIAGLGLVFAVIAQQTADARYALSYGAATSGQVTRVIVGGHDARITTVRVDAATGPVDTTLNRSAAGNVFVEGDVVQVMVDPQTRQVLLILGLLKPSPLYAPPKS